MIGILPGEWRCCTPVWGLNIRWRMIALMTTSLVMITYELRQVDNDIRLELNCGQFRSVIFLCKTGPRIIGNSQWNRHIKTNMVGLAGFWTVSREFTRAIEGPRNRYIGLMDLLITSEDSWDRHCRSHGLSVFKSLRNMILDKRERESVVVYRHAVSILTARYENEMKFN